MKIQKAKLLKAFRDAGVNCADFNRDGQKGAVGTGAVGTKTIASGIGAVGTGAVGTKTIASGVGAVGTGTME